MHIATLAQVRSPDRLYRCDSMPPGRAYLFGAIEGSVYIRADGSTEPFNWALEDRKYYHDETWVSVGHVSRLPPDGRIDLSKLQEVLAWPLPESLGPQ